MPLVEVPLGVVEVPPSRKKPPPLRLGSVTPCCLRQVVNALRLALALLAVVEVEAAFLLDADLLELLEPPQAVIAALAIAAAISGNAPRRVRVVHLMVSVSPFRFWSPVLDQPP